MRLLNQIIRKKMELSSEFQINRQYKRGIWNFYAAYSISLAILGSTDEQIKIRNKVWKRFLLKEFSEKNFKRINSLMQQDVSIIINALKLIQKIAEESGGDLGDLWKPSMVGVLSYEMPE